MTTPDAWEQHLDALDAWAAAVVAAARTGASALPVPTGGPEGDVPPRLRLRALAVVARMDEAERAVAAQRGVLERERAYSA